MSNLNNLTKERIYEEFFNLVSETCDWTEGYEGKRYYDYISGATDMTQRLLDIVGKIKFEFDAPNMHIVNVKNKEN